MAGNTVTLTFAGDADSLAQAAKKSEQSLAGVGAAADKSGKQLAEGAKSSADLTTKMGHLGSAVTGAINVTDTLGGSLSALNHLQNAGVERASRLAHAFNDVEQAQEDLQQALRDGAQAQIDSDQAALDLEQANLDAASALRDYNAAVKEHGKNSIEAKQAALDLKQANIDAKQANEDAAQATRDAAQATIDGKAAQLDLNDAWREAHPTDLQKWGEDLDTITPLLSAVASVVGVVTAAQWLWNASLFASPVTWIVLAIAALVAIIIVIATKTTWFQSIWEAVWGFLKDVGAWFAGPFADFFVSAWDKITGAFTAAWDWIKNTVTSGALWVHGKIEWFQNVLGAMVDNIKGIFSRVKDFITAPFRAAFNFVSDAWNNTIGRLRWTVPSWVPFVGGNTISAPRLPHFHTGGIVSGALGAETLAVLQAGERVTPAAGTAASTSGARTVVLDLGDEIMNIIRRKVGERGGNVQFVLGNNRG